MTKYTGISIGPIIKTLSMVRKPRELWSASYLFSHLMACIIESLPVSSTIVSPAKLKTKKVPVGLYPDRVFVKEGEEFHAQAILKQAIEKFSSDAGLSSKEVENYFNIMYLSLEASQNSEAVKKLNNQLDIIELSNRATSSATAARLLGLIKNTNNSPLYTLAFEKSKFPIGTLGEIATGELKNQNESDWEDARETGKLKEKMNEQLPELYKIIEEDAFYQKLKILFEDKYYSYHKYICVVQADGDNMGKVVSHVKNEDLMNLSESLLDFGSSACEKIQEYGGLPIYAGGDDLLFLAPVKSNGSIFSLIDELDILYSKSIKEKVDSFKLKDKEGNTITTSMSYGVSITYYKYPLYEALESARNLLFDVAKKVSDKNAVAWNLQRHSGSAYAGHLSKTDPVYLLFKESMEYANNENLVSAIAHKIRANESLLAILQSDKNHLKTRIEAFYKKTMEFEGKEEKERLYLQNTKEMLTTLLDRPEKIENIIKTMYGLLRTAKFINGEEDKL